jgi:hemoglobin-like flavoprotein
MDMQGEIAMRKCATTLTHLPAAPKQREGLSYAKIQLVQDTWAMVAPIADQTAVMFYNRLFEIDPTVKDLFRGDMVVQGRLLIGMIDTGVKGLGHLPALVPILEDLGRRHTNYRVEAQHYDTMGAALLWTLEQGMGDAFTPAVRQAWVDVYALMATMMRRAAYGA